MAVALVATALSACSTGSNESVRSKQQPTTQSNQFDTEDGTITSDEFALLLDYWYDEFGYELSGTRRDAQTIADEVCDLAYHSSQASFVQDVTDIINGTDFTQDEGGWLIGAIMATTCYSELEALGLT